MAHHHEPDSPVIASTTQEPLKIVHHVNNTLPTPGKKPYVPLKYRPSFVPPDYSEEWGSLFFILMVCANGRQVPREILEIVLGIIAAAPDIAHNIRQHGSSYSTYVPFMHHSDAYGHAVRLERGTQAAIPDPSVRIFCPVLTVLAGDFVFREAVSQALANTFSEQIKLAA